MAAIADIEITSPVALATGRTISELILAGNYAFTDPEITSEHFPEQFGRPMHLEIILLHFHKYLSTDHVLQIFESMGLRPAVLPELLILGEAQPALQRTLPILALGSVWQSPRGARLVPGLGGWTQRALLLYLFENGGSGSCRFAAIRKSTQVR